MGPAASSWLCLPYLGTVGLCHVSARSPSAPCIATLVLFPDVWLQQHCCRCLVFSNNNILLYVLLLYYD